ncbi:U3 small nucleolar RNA-associated protein 5 [Neolecta irregularis DAH-3]|uniref:U3 small nucleolar RNA-associated protein 5 n=1 Tax=Neolecta irregularis (strain DAH-3) TaxID=1198029 RepID=A0A1U7LNT1_NEOID|nr:U3 small nucleolar RNA-associated protein 5 [Neolecta irregularis DAH-3]|eukprot:OLL24202.1 U3 small nucleolar RNA-associated protein 5 [Neolecta irregularis DAH-3]
MVKHKSFPQATRSKHVSDTITAKTAFHPFLPLFASAVLSLDAYRLQIISIETGAVQSEYALDRGAECSCLSWGTEIAVADSHNKKKRKITTPAVSSEKALLAIGLASGDILLYSPTIADVVKTLASAHTSQVTDFLFVEKSTIGWSCGLDGRIVEWDLGQGKQKRKFSGESNNTRYKLAYKSPYLIHASHTIHGYKANLEKPSFTVTGHTSPIHSVIYSGSSSHFLTAAEGDRFVNIYKIDFGCQNIGALVSESDVEKLSGNDTILASLTADGTIELFTTPFNVTDSSKRRKSITRGSTSRITISRPDGQKVLPVDLVFRKDDIYIAWFEGPRTVLEAVRWRDTETKALVEKPIELVRKRVSTYEAKMNGVSNKGYQEAHSTTVAGNNMADMDIDEPEPSMTNGIHNEEKSDDEAEPTLGEKLQALELANPSTNTEVGVQKSIPASSLTVVLTQSLKTRDQALLETCLNHQDTRVVVATVQKMNPALAVELLELLAERMARKPARAGSLGIWVRWVIVAHGSHLITLPHLVKTLATLQSTLSARAATLPRLLELQGRLDIIDAHMELRKEVPGRNDDDDDDPEVEYLEGESEGDMLEEGESEESDEDRDEDDLEVLDDEEAEICEVESGEDEQAEGGDSE